ncbi:enamine deaminase RidA (YjgF/YER057c/UK114 family) [Angulomicrobium tetraedrale]|uniref:Enamine deaminase RidA (YjgF/YER057c/UK114 family) n=1 Tax=Ancylobacter tetraedralis TaxID=217068 RepID=A0A839ZF10_9HYPH|nr:RidA family protein [Ancylobacter tetraedralis]MBB3773421.1 enamine deaminase RidA (YjgF/YER057c/UK114 family) [Ancylobacter tetraedralis]
MTSAPITAFNPPGASWPGLSQGTMLRGSGIFLLTGHVGVDAQGEPVTSSLEDQIVALFENLRNTLKAGGLGFEHVGRLTAFVTDSDPAMIDTLRRVRARYLNPDAPPASVLVQVVALYDPRLRIEIEAIGVVP